MKKKPLPTDFALQITSMADVFVILLVFLLKSFSTEASAVSSEVKIHLPDVTKSRQLKPSIEMEISETEVIVDHKKILSLNNFSPDPDELLPNGGLRSVVAAFAILGEEKEEKKKEQEVLSKGDEAEKKRPPLLVLSDRKAPLAIVKRVLASASNQGFETFKLVVAEDQ